MDAATQTPGDILLDAGTNELEVLVFQMGKGWFGVNVAKVREVIRPAKTIAAPHQHPSVVGMFNIRGHVLPIVDLGLHLELKPIDQKGQTAAGEGRVIITEFNGVRAGFLVDTVEQIHRLSWQKVRPSPDLSVGEGTHADPAAHRVVSTTTGIVELGSRLVLMLDFESVADAILTSEKLHLTHVDNPDSIDRASKRVILAEDSPFMRELIARVFRDSGYTKAQMYSDGQAAWDAISSFAAAGEDIHAIVSDIEMPRMDGLHLTKRVRELPGFGAVPVVLFSSLISDDNKKKGQQVGASAQIPKPELEEMVRIVDRVVSGRPAQLTAQPSQHAAKPKAA